jgi:hypothetical protein
MKFEVMQNPHGILFDPASVAASLISYVRNDQYTPGDLFYLNERWQSWQHHSVYSHPDRDHALARINAAQEQAHHFMKRAKWLILTLGSAFSYRLTEHAPQEVQTSHLGEPAAVANCHRAPAQWFDKHLMGIEEIHSVLDGAIHQLFRFNPEIRLLFTVSPVRHIRDGVVNNNRSKARLIEVVHHLCNKFDRIHYFPAYEWVIDVLRDYRFFDLDMVHPNYQATRFVLEKFKAQFIDEESRALMQEVLQIVISRKHKPFHSDTRAHRQFLQTRLEKVQELKSRYPFLHLEEELNYFSVNKD